MTAKFTVREDLCTACGVCARVCPKGLIGMDMDGPFMTEENSGLCNSCGQCVAFCPAGAARQAISGDAPLYPALQHDPARTETVLSFLRSRRSYRTYAPEPVEHAVIERILETADWSPTGGNNRRLRWIVVETPEKTAELRGLIAGWFDGDARRHPVFSKRYKIDAIMSRYKRGVDVILRGAPHVVFMAGPSDHVWGPVDTGIALAYFNFAAEAFDVGCCFAGYATGAAQGERVRAFLGVQPGETVWCAACFGRKTIAAQRVPARNRLPVTLI
ncbi:MAG: nitroreductase family protein [Duodenibacillus sp.]|nr:nitroreductase family protein [Duodenibacillus sp.]